jgi:hypothetical protein
MHRARRNFVKGYQKGTLMVAMASVALIWGSGGAAQAQPAHTSMSDTIASSTSSYHSVSELVNADRSVTDRWTDGSTVVTVSGARGTLVRAASQAIKSGSKTSVTAEASATAPALGKTAAAAAAAINAYAEEGRSVVNDAVATGMDRATAQRVFDRYLFIVRWTGSANPNMVGLGLSVQQHDRES